MIALLAAAALATAPQPVPFEVLSVGIDLRTFTVAYESGPCWPGDPTELQVEQNDGSVRLALLQQRLAGCAEAPTYRKLAVHLRRPLAGRRITGAPRIAGAPASLRRRAAPRLNDLDAADARRTLALQGFRTRQLGRAGGPVSFQSPLPGRRPRDGVVRLTVGRELFRARALARCLDRAGIPTVTRKPRPGDFDAPDLVFWLRHPDAMASVAVYRDPVRATELAPVVRRNVRRIHGLFERRRHVAIAWYAAPAADLREGAKRCVYSPLARPRT